MEPKPRRLSRLHFVIMFAARQDERTAAPIAGSGTVSPEPADTENMATTIDSARR